MLPVSQTRTSVNRKPTRSPIRSSRRRNGPSGNERVGQASRTNKGETVRINVPKHGDLERLGQRVLIPARKEPAEDVAPDHVQQDHRQDQSERLPRLENHVPAEPARRVRALTDLQARSAKNKPHQTKS